jgi:two-component system, NtrC family, sensor histidine kinase HydH
MPDLTLPPAAPVQDEASEIARLRAELDRLVQRERQHVDELNLLLDTGRVITASLDLDEILDVSAVNLARMVGASDSFIWLLDFAEGKLCGATTSAREHREHFRSVCLELSDPSLAARAVVVRGPVQASDALRAGEVNQTLNTRYRMQSLLALPLMLRDEPIGSVVIGDATRVRTWAPGEVERATIMARYVAVAVANARLFDDLKKSYAELAQRERLAALGELSAVVAHEVRNPLAVIWSSLSTLRKRVPGGGDVTTLLDILGEESVRLKRIVDDLLDFAHPHEPSLRAEALDAIVLGAIDSARHAGLPGGIELRWDPTRPVAPVLVDAHLLRQAFLNLVMNAVQAMPKGGRVTIRATEERRDENDYARVDVIDEGPGIAPGVARRVFQPFFTTKATGTGLGLAVVKRIIEAHNGHVTFHSEQDAGATFTVRLPLAPAAPEGPALPAEPGP